MDRDGYGVVTMAGRRTRMHRFIYETIFGPQPGLVIRHKCDNRLCYRIDHLEVGTVAQNNADAAGRGHLGPAPKLPPSAVQAIIERKAAGETNASIHADFPDVSLATIKRVK